MKDSISRRDFLKLGSGAVALAAVVPYVRGFENAPIPLNEVGELAGDSLRVHRFADTISVSKELMDDSTLGGFLIPREYLAPLQAMALDADIVWPRFGGR